MKYLNANDNPKKNNRCELDEKFKKIRNFLEFWNRSIGN